MFRSTLNQSTSRGGRARIVVGLAAALATVAAPALFASAASAAVASPASCSDVHAASPSAVDGDYTLTVFGQKLTVWCASLASNPTPYLDLVATGSMTNYTQWGPGGSYGGPYQTVVQDNFTKVKLVLPTTASGRFAVDTLDLTFSSNPKAGLHGTGYASAGSCTFQPATGNVDLTGTPFAINPSDFTVWGYYGGGKSTVSSNNQIVSLSGQGDCGGDKSPNILPLVWLHSLSTVTTMVLPGGRTASLANLTLGSNGSATSVNYSQVNQNATGSTVLSVDDSTGSGAGWVVTTQVSPFVWSAAGGSATSAPNIPAANFAVTSVGAVSTSAGTTWNAAPVAVTGALNSPVVLLKAAVSSGEGTYTIPVNLSLMIPGTTRAGTYTATLTTTIAVAP